MMKSMFYLITFWPMIFNLMLIFLINYPPMSNKSPMLLMITLIFLTLLTTLKMNLLFNSWISFFMFLTIIGGLMVIYMYITSLANNELFSININKILMNFMKLSLILLIYLFLIMKNNEINLFNLNNSMSWTNNNFNMNLNLFNFLYKENNNKTSYFLMMYLYYSMICIMSICLKFKAPLRQIKF